MKIAIGSDDTGPAPESVIEALRELGHDVTPCGRLAGNELGWAEIAHDVATRVTDGNADQGVLFCWTGTGVSIAANKVNGVRAALCGDAETARGARLWNDANVLCMSLRTTTPTIAREIIAAWLSVTTPDPEEAPQIGRIESPLPRVAATDP